ncbi:hypothetical protein ACEWY4_009155 [Coilia grayii]|uniref:Uncharacterized protein n=1 Tax=Coilia grayii TaxID=363190 RepID=A0ABD1K5L3_9TELE
MELGKRFVLRRVCLRLPLTLCACVCVSICLFVCVCVCVCVYRKKLTERSEASLQVSEFAVNAEGAGEKVALADLLRSSAEASRSEAALTRTHRQLKNLQAQQATLELPLSRQQTEKIQREAAFEKASKEVSRWESTVVQHQRAEQLVFPLNQQSHRPQRIEQRVSHWKSQTPLEQEVFALLHAHRQPSLDPVLTPVEEAQLQAMSLEEAQLRRAELQKARALQSYYEAKAKRERKIKSKKYHKVALKSKRKAALLQFEELCKSDPQRAAEELQKMERDRIEERMSLKHQNSGKWAKSKAIMAKYDLGARQAMQEQLELNRQLTHKPLPSSELHGDSDHDEEEAANEEQTLPDMVNEAANQRQGANPWMSMAAVMATTQQEAVTGGVNATDSEAIVSGAGGGDGEGEVRDETEVRDEEEESEEERLLGEFARRRQLRKTHDEEQQDQEPSQGPASPSTAAALDDDGGGGDEEEGDDEDGSEEEEGLMDEAAAVELNALFGRLARQGHAHSAATVITATGGTAPDATLLDEDTTRIRTLDDTHTLADTHSDSAPTQVEVDAAEPRGDVDDPAPKVKGRRKVIDLEQVLTKEASTIRVPMATPTVEDAEDEALDEQTAVIQEAFAGDDVISDFLKEKRKREEAGQPKDVDLTLPGWGQWGGLGVKSNKRRRRRFLKKAPPPAPRKDRKLPAVIISETRDASLASHQVSQLPFPFESPAQFERSVRAPLGSTWNPELAVRKLTAPRVITKAGAIIQPMSREDLAHKRPSAGKRGAPDIQLGGAENKGGQRRQGPKNKKHKT